MKAFGKGKEISAVNDDTIVGLFMARNEQAIVEAKAKYGSFCRRIAQNVLGNAEDAEECFSDVLLILWNNIPPEQPRSLKAYVTGITRRQAIKRLRDRNTQSRSGSIVSKPLDELEECLPSSEDVEKQVEANVLTKLIDDWLSLLSNDDRVLFLRRYWYEDSISELAEKLHESPGRVTKRLFRLRKKLGKYLENEGFSV